MYMQHRFDTEFHLSREQIRELVDSLITCREYCPERGYHHYHVPTDVKLPSFMIDNEVVFPMFDSYLGESLTQEQREQFRSTYVNISDENVRM